jgi:diguanylate cyclase (GGDEF)-like protein
MVPPHLALQIEQVHASLLALQHQLRNEKHAVDVDRPSYDELRKRLLYKNKTVDTLEDRVQSLESMVRRLEREMHKLEDRSVLERRDLVQANTELNQMSHIAFYDVLTQLPNRRFFDRALGLVCEKSRRLHRFSALMYIDIDRFRTVNDLLGHAAGDALLMMVARRLNSSLRKADTLARLGGDEFGVIFGLISSSNEAATQAMTAAAQKVCQAMRNPFALSVSDGHGLVTKIEYPVEVSIGVVVFDASSQSAAHLIDAADKAMYEAKQHRGNQVYLLSL